METSRFPKLGQTLTSWKIALLQPQNNETSFLTCVLGPWCVVIDGTLRITRQDSFSETHTMFTQGTQPPR